MKIMVSDACQIVTNLQHVGDSCGSIHDMLHVSSVVFSAPASGKSDATAAAERSTCLSMSSDISDKHTENVSIVGDDDTITS